MESLQVKMESQQRSLLMEGQVAWIGHPMRMDEPLAEIVNGTWDLASSSRCIQKGTSTTRHAMMDFEFQLRNCKQLNEDWDGYITAIDEFTAEYGENPTLAEMKFNALLTGKKDKASCIRMG